MSEMKVHSERQRPAPSPCRPFSYRDNGVRHGGLARTITAAIDTCMLAARVASFKDHTLLSTIYGGVHDGSSQEEGHFPPLSARSPYGEAARCAALWPEGLADRS